MSDRQVRVLLTGGIGAGKSSVGELLRARGALVIDADQVGHQVLEPGRAAYDQVAKTWPSVVVDGGIDRRRLADIVFEDIHELRKLEKLMHPAIRQRIGDLVEGSEATVVVVEVPLLSDFMGSGWTRVVVDAPVDVRLTRLAARESGDAMRRMSVQPSSALWRKSADLVIDNAGDLDQLNRQVDDLLETLRNPSKWENSPLSIDADHE